MIKDTTQEDEVGIWMGFFAPLFWASLILISLMGVLCGITPSQQSKINKTELARDVEVLFSDIESYYAQHDNYFGIDIRASGLSMNRLASPKISSSQSSNYMRYLVAYDGLSEEVCLTLGIKGVQKFSTVNVNGSDVTQWFKVVNHCRGDDEVRFTSLPKSENNNTVVSNDLDLHAPAPAPDLPQEASINTPISCQNQAGDEMLYRGKVVTIVESQGSDWYRVKNRHGESSSVSKSDLECTH